MLVLTILGYTLLFIYEFLPLYKQKMWRDLWVNGALGTVSFAIALLLCLDVKIPSPVKPIKEFITSMFGK